jgi:NAD(P)-dependent dehydrogenase (short-subunit alcohol dehydrogenase family)
MVSYGASKAGLPGLTRQVAVDHFDDGVSCNMVAPGWVDTPGERVIQADHGRPEFPKGTRNLITVEEIGAAVVYLASPPGRRVNGAILYVDSGLHVADNAEMVYLPPADARGYT